MKKTLLAVTALFAASLLFLNTACSSDDSSSASSPDSSSTTANEDGTTTLTIQENGSGFVSSTFSESTDFPGYTGSGYFDGGTSANGSIVYTVSAAEAITDAKIAIHYLCTEVTRRRAALVSVNGTVINESNPLQMTTDTKVKKANCTSDNWKDTTYLTGVSLNKGSNSIIITGCPDWTYTASDGTTTQITDSNCYLNYVDYLIVIGTGIDYGTDTTKYVSLSCATENETAGSVTSTATSSTVAEDSSVTFTATASEGWTFQCWSDGSTSNPYTKTISEATYLFAHFIPTGATNSSDLVGYAAYTSDSAAAYTITGGKGASSENTVTISTYEGLTSTYAELLSSDEPKVVTISGTISTADQSNPLLSVKVNVGSNTTIYGDQSNQGRLRNIELNVEGENIIIRNLMMGEVIGWDDYTKSGADDALCLNGATHVWIDHCEFQSHLYPQDLDGNDITSSNDYYSTKDKWKKDFYDGLLDVKNGSTWITISNCYFHDHWKACLCASGDGSANKNTTTGATDEDMRITFYHNYWKDISARQPLFRWGKAHILNSYYITEDTTYLYSTGGNTNTTAVNCRAKSELYINNNSFNNIKTTIGYYNDESYSISGTWTNVDNVFNSCTNTPAESSCSYEPPYSWTGSTPSSAPTPGTDVGVGCSITLD